MSVMGTSSAVAAGSQMRLSRAFHDIEAEIAAALDPLVMLLGEHGATSRIGALRSEDPDHVDATVDLG
jgi:hypothetical protein